MNLGHIANGFNGFNKGADEEKARQRLASDRLYQDEQRARLRKTQGEDDAVKDGLRSASASVPQVEAQQPDPFEVDGGGAVNPGFKFQDKFYAERGLADSARTQAQSQAAQGVYAKAGRFEDAQRLDTAATQSEASKLGLASARKADQRGDEDHARKKAEIARLMRKEGAFDSVEAMAKGDLDGFMEASAKGDWRPIAGTVKITPVDSVLGGVKTRSYDWTFQVKGPNGEIKDMAKNSLDMQREIQPYATQLQQNRADRKDNREDADSASLVNYRNSMAGKYDAQAANGGGSGAPKSAFERMDEFDKTKLVSINKQREMIQQSIIKGSAEGSYDPASPGAKGLQTQMALLNKQESALTAKYGDSSPKADPLGVRKPAPQGGGATTAAAPGSKRGGQIEVLDQEMEKAQAALSAADTPEKKTRVQGDIDSLTREFKNLKAEPSGRKTVAAAAGIPTKAERPAAAKPEPKPEPRSDLSPQAEAAGVDLDKAKEALKTVSSQARPGLAAGRAAMDAYAAKLSAAKEEVAKRQAQYERLVPAQGVAFSAKK